MAFTSYTAGVAVCIYRFCDPPQAGNPAKEDYFSFDFISITRYSAKVPVLNGIAQEDIPEVTIKSVFPCLSRP